jgi:hypothetical protein
MDFTGKEEGKDWKLYKGISPSGPSIPPGLLQKIQARTNEVNEVLTQLFEYFNNQTHQQKKPPRWNVESSWEACMHTLKFEEDLNRARSIWSETLRMTTLWATFRALISVNRTKGKR